MQPLFVIKDYSVKAYWLFALLGSIITIVYVVIANRCQKERRIGKIDGVNLILIALICTFVGGKIPGLCRDFIQIKESLQPDSTLWEVFRAFLFGGGMIYYSGMVAMILGVFAYASRYRLPYDIISVYLGTALPLFFGIVRIGCFFSGCCYGIPAHWGIAMAKTPDILRIPVQLLESGYNLLLFTVLVLWAHRTSSTRNRMTLPLYLAAYSSGRFVLEFIRGDEARGFFGGLSSGQWSSIAVWVGLLMYVCLRHRMKKRNSRCRNKKGGIYEEK